MTRHRRWIAAACLTLVAALVFVTRVRREMADFEVYRIAGARAAAGEALYRADDGHWQFKYLPAFAFVVAPISSLPAGAGRAVWFGLSVALLVLVINRSLVWLPDRRRTAAALVGLTVVALGKFYLHEINLGQSNLLLAALVLGAVGSWRTRREVLGGVFLAAATVVKPYAIVFLPYLVVRRQWRGIASFILLLLAVLLLPALRYGWTGNLDQLGEWWAVVSTSTAPNLLGQDNVSLAGMFAAWSGVGARAAWLAAAASLVLVLACGWTFLRRTTSPFPEYLDAALLLVVIPLLSPQGWDYVLVIATPAVMLLVDRFDTFGKAGRCVLAACLAVVGLTIFDLMGRELYGAFMMSRVLTLCVLGEIGFLVGLRTRNLA